MIYPLVTDLAAEGIPVAVTCRVLKFRDHGIWSVFSKKRGLNRKPGPPVHDDLVERDFTAAAPNELWLTDITEHPQQRASSTSAR
jgi:putative transposase